MTQFLLQDWQPFDARGKLPFADGMDGTNFETDAAGAEHSSGAGFWGFCLVFPFALLYVLKAGYGSRYISSSVAQETQVLFLEQKPDEKYTFVFHLLGSSLDSIKGDPAIWQRDQPP